MKLLATLGVVIALGLAIRSRRRHEAYPWLAIDWRDWERVDSV